MGPFEAVRYPLGRRIVDRRSGDQDECEEHSYREDLHGALEGRVLSIRPTRLQGGVVEYEHRPFLPNFGGRDRN